MAGFPSLGAYVALGKANNTAPTPDQTVVGNTTDSTNGGKFAFQVVEDFASPNSSITQAFVSCAFFSGTPGASQGTMEGGSSQATAYNNSPGDYTQAVLGFEGIAYADGNTTNGVAVGSQVIGLQGAARAQGTITTPLLISLQAAGPEVVGGTPTVTESRSLNVLEPTAGTTKRAIYSVGTARFRKGTAANSVELSDGSDVMRWSTDGTTWTGYASDGASTRLQIDTNDTPTNARFTSYLFGSGNHILCENSSSPVFRVEADGTTNIWGNVGFYGQLAVAQPSATGTATGYAAGTTAATFHSDDTYTGNTGTTAYTVNGIVAALKSLGLLKA